MVLAGLASPKAASPVEHDGDRIRIVIPETNCHASILEKKPHYSSESVDDTSLAKCYYLSALLELEGFMVSASSTAVSGLFKLQLYQNVSKPFNRSIPFPNDLVVSSNVFPVLTSVQVFSFLAKPLLEMKTDVERNRSSFLAR